MAKKTSKNQLTLPKAIVDRFPGVDYFDVREEDGRIILSPAVPGGRTRSGASWLSWASCPGTSMRRCAGHVAGDGSGRVRGRPHPGDARSG